MPVDSSSANRERPEVVCPACRGALDENPTTAALRCVGCGEAYPVVMGSLPLLVPDPARYVTGERATLTQYSSHHRAMAGHYRARAAEGGIRAGTLSDLADGLDHNAGMLADLEELLPPSDAELETYLPPAGSDLFSCLRVDWSGAEEAEAEIRTTVEAVSRVMAGCPPGSYLVLGAGTGRLLAELECRYPGAVGIDLSFAAAAAFCRLDAGESVSAYHLYTGNFRRAEDECDRIDARRELCAGSPRYLVADAVQTPFPDASFDAVLSLNFTDMVPLSRLLPEVARLLAPGGRMVHHGPLGYAFPDVGEHYALDQLPAAFALHGFEPGEPEFVENTLLVNASRLNRFGVENLLFTAWPAASSAGEPSPAP